MKKETVEQQTNYYIFFGSRIYLLYSFQIDMDEIHTYEY